MTVVGNINVNININVMTTKCWSIAIVAVDGISMVSVQEHSDDLSVRTGRQRYCVCNCS